MSEDDSWRSEAAYEYIDKLTPSELAWEFLRRNPDYRKSYQELMVSGRIAQENAAEFGLQWGLRFRSRSTCNGACSTDLLDPANRSRCDSPQAGARTCHRLRNHR